MEIFARSFSEQKDIILVIILGVALSLLIGYNIINTIDNKLSNIYVNMPPIPEPKVVVKIEKNNGKYDVFVNNNIQKSDMNIENFESIGNSKEGNVKLPKEDNIVKYNNYVCYKNDKENMEIKKDNVQTEKIPNEYNNKNYYEIDRSKKPENACKNDFVYENNSYRITTKVDPDESNPCVYLHDDTGEIDPNIFYKSRARIIKSYLDDPKMKGFNTQIYDQFSAVKEIGNIKLENKSKFPVGIGHIFNIN